MVIEPNTARPLSSNPRKKLLLAVVLGLLLLTTFSRMMYLAALPMNNDEVWSIWQTFGTAQDVINWTPKDWPPLYFLIVWAWQHVTSITPEALRLLSVLTSLVGTALFYRASRRVWNEKVALVGTLAFSALAFDIFLGLLVRGYIFILALTPMALWFAIRYFYRPTLWRAICLAVPLVLLFYIHFTGAFIILMVGVYTLVVYPRSVWRWWLPGIISAPLIVLEILSKLYTFTSRTVYNGMQSLPPFAETVYRIFEGFTGLGASTHTAPTVYVWAALFIVSTLALFVMFWKFRNRKVVAFVLWIGILVPLYVFHSRFGLIQDVRYVWFVVPGFIWWIGWGLAQLPRPAMAAATLALLAAMFWPGVIDNYQASLYRNDVPMEQTLSWLKGKIQPGDVIYVDKGNFCGPTEIWDYFMRIYFPNGLPFVSSVEGNPRVWFVASWNVDKTVEQALLREHVADEYYGSPACLFRLYKSPPQTPGTAFENGMVFQGAEMNGLQTPNGKVFHSGEAIHVKLYWSINQAVKLDYSVSLFMVTPSGIIRSDGPPQVADAPHETSRWVWTRYYVDERTLQLPYAIDEGNYPIYLAVYTYWDQKRVAAPGVDKDNALPLETVYVHVWN